MSGAPARMRPDTEVAAGTNVSGHETSDQVTKAGGLARIPLATPASPWSLLENGQKPGTVPAATCVSVTDLVMDRHSAAPLPAPIPFPVKARAPLPVTHICWVCFEEVHADDLIGNVCEPCAKDRLY